MYTFANNTLYVYIVSDLASPIGTYGRRDLCFSGMTSDDRLYLGGESKLRIFKVASSLNQPPLTPVIVVSTKKAVIKIVRVGNELLLGELAGYLEVLDIKTSTITSTYKFTSCEDTHIRDIVAIDDSRFLLASQTGILKTTKDQEIKLYKKFDPLCLCHVTDSIYLVSSLSFFNL